MSLTYKELKQLRASHRSLLYQLESCCRKTDGTLASVCHSTELNCRRDIPVFFLAYQNHELIAFLSLFLPDGQTAELNALVHPEYRRQGLFTELLRRAKLALAGTGTNRLLFVCEPQAKDSAAAMLAMKAVKDCSEYRMLLARAADSPLLSQECFDVTCAKSLSASASVPRGELLPAASASVPRGELLPAAVSDLPVLGQMNALFFDTSAEQGALWAEQCFDTPNITIYKYVLPDDQNQAVPIGTLSFCEENSSGNIFGLGILPEYRGHGYGKHMLQSLLSILPPGKEIYLQVSDRNAAAFCLYQKAGFQIVAQQDFWLLP